MAKREGGQGLKPPADEMRPTAPPAPPRQRPELLTDSDLEFLADYFEHKAISESSLYRAVGNKGDADVKKALQNAKRFTRYAFSFQMMLEHRRRLSSGDK